MVLHGCQQYHEDIRAISNFDAIADRAGFIVVYPSVTSYRDIRLENCWGWWMAKEIRPGGGEVEAGVHGPVLETAQRRPEDAGQEHRGQAQERRCGQPPRTLPPSP